MNIGIHHTWNINRSFALGVKKATKLFLHFMSQEIMSEDDVLQKKFCM